MLSGAPDTVLNNPKEEPAQSVQTEEEITEIDNGTDAGGNSRIRNANSGKELFTYASELR